MKNKKQKIQELLFELLLLFPFSPSLPCLIYEMNMPLTSVSSCLFFTMYYISHSLMNTPLLVCLITFVFKPLWILCHCFLSVSWILLSVFFFLREGRLLLCIFFVHSVFFKSWYYYDHLLFCTCRHPTTHSVSCFVSSVFRFVSVNVLLL